MLNNFVSYQLWDVLFWEGGLAERDRKGHGGRGGQKCPVFRGCP